MDLDQETTNQTSTRMSKRFDPVTGKYNMKPLDPEYFNKYYHKNNVPTTCKFCGKTVGKMKMQRHLETTTCMQTQIAWGRERYKQLNEKQTSAHEIEDMIQKFSELLRAHPIPAV
jgi:hypothetical protein